MNTSLLYNIKTAKEIKPKTSEENTKAKFAFENDKAKMCMLMANRFLTAHQAIYLDGALYLYSDFCYRHVQEPENLITQWIVEQQRYVPGKGTASGVLDFVRAMSTPKGLSAPRPPFFRPECSLPGSPRDYIPFNNGLLNVSMLLREGRVEMHRHTPDFISFYCLPYDFNFEATCPRWEAFLHDVMEGDGERIKLIQEWFGYCLTDDVSLQKFMLFLGVTRAGKGTTSNVLGALIGNENFQAFDMNRLVDRFSLASLRTKQLAIIGEVELSGAREKNRIVEKFKSITGNDPQPIERKGVDVTEDAVLPTRFMLSANQLPPLHDCSGALDSRMLVVRFNRTAAGREDFGLLEKLKTELPGIAVWSIVGLRRLKESSWTRPASSVAEKNNFRKLSSVPLAFLQDACVLHRPLLSAVTEGVEGEDELREIDRTELHEAFSWWAIDQDMERQTFNWFCRDVKALVPNFPEAKQVRAGGGRKRVIQGVRLKEEFRQLMQGLRPRRWGDGRPRLIEDCDNVDFSQP